MTWNDIKKCVDVILSEEEKKNEDIFYIDTGNYPDKIKIYRTKDGIIISS